MPRWWTSFGSNALDRLMAQALEPNPGLQAARQTLVQARYQLKAAEGVFYPQVSLGAVAERLRSSGADSGGLVGPRLYDLYTGQLDVSYYPDAFGLNRLVAQNARAQVDVAHEQLRAALEEKIDATARSVADERAILDRVRKQYAAGRFDMGLVIATGLAIGALFSLYVVPTIYAYLAADKSAAGAPR